jgi:hypothetical protein
MTVSCVKPLEQYWETLPEEISRKIAGPELLKQGEQRVQDVSNRREQRKELKKLRKVDAYEKEHRRQEYAAINKRKQTARNAKDGTTFLLEAMGAAKKNLMMRQTQPNQARDQLLAMKATDMNYQKNVPDTEEGRKRQIQARRKISKKLQKQQKANTPLKIVENEVRKINSERFHGTLQSAEAKLKKDPSSEEGRFMNLMVGLGEHGNPNLISREKADKALRDMRTGDKRFRSLVQ